MRFGTIPIEDLYNNGLFLTFNGDFKSPYTGYRIKQIPGVDIKEHSDDMYVNVSFPKEMDFAFLEVKRSMGGYTSTGIQPYWNLMDEADKRNLPKIY